MRLANSENAYTFEVDRKATKNQIAESVAALYGVTVKKVNMIMQASQIKRTGKKRSKTTVGKTKKAIVTLKEGQTLDVFDINPEANK
jgi:large subunit ribosomal protein L23